MSNDRTTPLLFDFAESDSADKTTNYLKLTPGDFLKNAGNVGFLRLWEFICRDRGEEFEIVDEIPIEKLPDEKKLAQYIMDLYISEYSGDSRIQKAFDKLDELTKQTLVEPSFDDGDGKVKLIEGVKELLKVLKPTKPLKGDFNSIIKHAKQYDLYLEFYDKEGKVKKDIVEENPIRIFMGLRAFCEHQKVKQAFLFREATNNLIDPFLQNKSFFDYSNNSGKNAESLIEKDFTQPFIQCLEAEVKRGTNSKSSRTAIRCISCSSTLAKTSDRLTFLKDVVDDLEYKASLFWNFKPDAYICPICVMIYLMAPLGFRRVGDGDFVFINSDSSLKILWDDNAKRIDDIENGTNSVQRRVDTALLKLLDDRSKILSNSQVIIRNKLKGKRDKNGNFLYRYQFNIIDRDLHYLIHEERLPNSSSFESIRDYLGRLVKIKSFKTSNGDDFNIYQHCLDNVLYFRNQYNLLNMLILNSLRTNSKKNAGEEIQDQKWLNLALSFVFRIQCLQTYHIHRGEECDPMKNISKLQFCASKEGASMRKRLLINAVGEEKAAQLPTDRKEDIIRSVVYRLANALKTRNVELFVDTLIRLYSSCKEPIPTVFMTALRNEEVFPLVGYAYLLGLKGAFYQSEKAEEAENPD